MKKTKKLIGTVWLILAMAMIIPSFVPQMSERVTVEAASKVKLNKTKAMLYVGKSTRLKVDGTTKDVTWKSSNKKVATVSSKGKVTAKKKGKATIIANVDGKKYTCKITVKEIALKSITLNKTSVTINKGASCKLKVTYNPSNTTVEKNVKWSSSDPSVATVDKKGKIYGSSSGKAIITAKVGNKKAKCTVTVKKVKVNKLTKLINYIEKYGNTNSKGNRFISMSRTIDGNEISHGIVYEKNTNKLKFVEIYEGSGAESAMVMYMEKNSQEVSPEFVLVFDYSYASCKAKTSFNASTYTGNDTLHFEVENSNGLTDAQIQEIANANLRLAFSGWNLLLLEKTGLELRDIGFTSYR